MVQYSKYLDRIVDVGLEEAGWIACFSGQDLGSLECVRGPVVRILYPGILGFENLLLS